MLSRSIRSCPDGSGVAALEILSGQRKHSSFFGGLKDTAGRVARLGIDPKWTSKVTKAQNLAERTGFFATPAVLYYLWKKRQEVGRHAALPADAAMTYSDIRRHAAHGALPSVDVPQLRS